MYVQDVLVPFVVRLAFMNFAEEKEVIFITSCKYLNLKVLCSFLVNVEKEN